MTPSLPIEMLGSQVLRLAASRGGGPETRSGTVQSLKCCPCQQKRAARLPRRSIKRGGPETRSGTVQSLKCCPCQQKRAARLPSAAPGSIKAGGPQTRSGTVQCQQKRAARLPSAAPGSIKGGGAPKRARAPSRAWSAAPASRRNALGYRPEPGVLPLPAETSREAPKCCAWQHQGGGGPETRSGTVQTLKCCPCQQKRAASWQHQGGGGPNQVLRLAASRGAPKRARVPSRA